MSNSTTFFRRKGYGYNTINNIVELLATKGYEANNCRMDKRHKSANILFRWGCTGYFYAEKGVEINPTRAIHLAANKKNCRLWLQENGFSVPKTFTSINSVPKEFYPLIVRKPYHHGGTEIIFIKSPEEDVSIPWYDYYISEFLNKTREIRVLCFNNRVFSCIEKTQPDFSRDINSEDFKVAWNHNVGADFTNIRWNNWPIEACKESLLATSFIGLNFSAVDLVFYENKWYILEINTAPSLSPYRIKCFTKAYINFLENGFQNPAENFIDYSSVIDRGLLEVNFD